MLIMYKRNNFYGVVNADCVEDLFWLVDEDVCPTTCKFKKISDLKVNFTTFKDEEGEKDIGETFLSLEYMYDDIFGGDWIEIDFSFLELYGGKSFTPIEEIFSGD